MSISEEDGATLKMTSLQQITCQHAGATLVGQIAMPDASGPRPAVMVMHDAHGLGTQVLETARALAELGYIALATDMYGGGVLHADPKDAGVSLAPLWNDPHLLRARVMAWFDTLQACRNVDNNRLAAIGYCFGGQCVLELARGGANVKAVVSYHGILKTKLPAQPGVARAHIAVYTGGKDPYAPPEDVEALRQEMMAVGVRTDITVFSDAYHSFTNPEKASSGVQGLAYDAVAHRVSWAGTLALLEQAFA
jgi:dienelactone hydrolase